MVKKSREKSHDMRSSLIIRNSLDGIHQKAFEHPREPSLVRSIQPELYLGLVEVADAWDCSRK